MNPISKKIINKLSQEDKTELKSEKIELAKRKPQSVLSNGKAIDKALASYSAKIDRSYLDYTKSWQKFDQQIDSLQSDLQKFNEDIRDTEAALRELGINENAELEQSKKISSKLQRILRDYKKLYPKI
jgi:hypothetical protein